MTSQGRRSCRTGRAAGRRATAGDVRRWHADLPPPAKRKRTNPDEVWNESDIFQDSVASGDCSADFLRPWHQNGVANVVRGSRGYRDISMKGAVYESPIPYWSIPGQGTGFILGVGGTSAATPLVAGFVAVAAQLAVHDLGLIKPTLCARHVGEVGVTVQTNDTPAVTGFDVTRGYDLAGGWDTIDAAKLAWSFVYGLTGGISSASVP